MRRFGRRRLIEKLSAALAAPLLRPVARALVGEALGAAAPPRRCAVFCVIGENLPSHAFVPDGVPDYALLKKEAPAPLDRSGITLPPVLAALEPFRSKTVIIDGLSNPLLGTSQHGMGFGLLTALPTDGSPGMGGGPKGISIDQFIANTIGRDTPLPSLRFGQEVNFDQTVETASTFAAGPYQPLPHTRTAAALYAKLVGKSTALDPTGTVLQARLLDSLRDDVRTLETQLAGEERARLGTYLQAVDDFDRRQQSRTVVQANPQCQTFPAAGDATLSARLDSMFGMAALALRCGMTNVIGISFSHSAAHDDLKCFFPNGYDAHGPAAGYYTCITQVWSNIVQRVAGMLVSSGMADNTVAALIPGSGSVGPGSADSEGRPGGTHHGGTDRTPVFLVDGTGTLKTGARYLRFGPARALADVYSAIAHAAGAPVDDFGRGGMSRVLGPPAELMA